ncbi:unnamed protein product [Leptidea sinapis]|uniref:C-type lectin domain-containing protein n=1 Tax=Leptidea sinapis TaxID=189913 RepID=A0A5E4QJZ5_9NEOP|nr:unnamed protein product [Leptidea sinapis]
MAARVVLVLALINCVSTRQLPSDYIVNKSLQSAYRLVYQSETWPVARDRCEDQGGHLAVPDTQEEFEFLQKLVRGMHYPSIVNRDVALVVWLGINNLDDYRIWKNIFGQNIKDSSFSTWSGDNGQGFSDDPEEPHCAAIDPINPGLRDYWCHRRQPYLCEININEI